MLVHVQLRDNIAMVRPFHWRRPPLTHDGPTVEWEDTVQAPAITMRINGPVVVPSQYGLGC